MVRFGAFTDDTALFYKADTPTELDVDIQQDILMLRMWFSDNYMIIKGSLKRNLWHLAQTEAQFSQQVYNYILSITVVC